MTKVHALVLERQNELALREIEIPLSVGPGMVRIAIHTVGICGSDVHYYTHGRIGGFVVQKPMVLGHEAAGTPYRRWRRMRRSRAKFIRPPALLRR